MLWSILACTQEAPPTTWCDARGEAFGTTWSVTYAGPCDGEVQPRAEAVLAEVDAQMSSWRDDSELRKIRATEGPVTVSADTQAVVRDALALAEATQGAFDPTVQPLMEVWGFHSKEREIEPPTPEALAGAMAQVGWSRVKVGVSADGPWVDGGGTALDLSAIAKGHGVDRVSHSLSQAGHRRHMVEVGGEVRTAGDGPRGAWALGVDSPEEGAVPGANLAAVILVSNASLATSGNYRNVVEVDGRRVHHTMDPRTGQPALSDIASASVLAPDCRTADALATAVMVLGSEEGLALIEGRSDVEALILVSGSDGWEQRASSGMGRFLQPR